MITIERVWIEWLVDADPDLSWLDTDADYHFGKDGCNWARVPAETIQQVLLEDGSLRAACERYAVEDQERLSNYYKGKWCMLGCVAKSTVRVPCGRYFRTQEFSSTGLRGIESDSNTDYHTEIEDEQLNDLKEYLAQFSVDTSDFAERRV